MDSCEIQPDWVNYLCTVATATLTGVGLSIACTIGHRGNERKKDKSTRSLRGKKNKSQRSARGKKNKSQRSMRGKKAGGVAASKETAAKKPSAEQDKSARSKAAAAAADKSGRSKKPDKEKSSRGGKKDTPSKKEKKESASKKEKKKESSKRDKKPELEAPPTPSPATPTTPPTTPPTASEPPQLSTLTAVDGPPLAVTPPPPAPAPASPALESSNGIITPDRPDSVYGGDGGGLMMGGNPADKSHRIYGTAGEAAAAEAKRQAELDRLKPKTDQVDIGASQYMK